MYISRIITLVRTTFYNVDFKCVDDDVQVILPTCLRDYVPAVHRALLNVTYSLRRLQGQVVSLAEANSLNIEPGSPIVHRGSLRRVRVNLVEGLSGMEGSLPPNHINPLAHRLVHYPDQTAAYARLWGLSMKVFERYNKRIKGMVAKNSDAEASIATNIQLEIATRFVELSSDDIEDDIVEVRQRSKICSIQRIRKFPRRYVSARDHVDV